LTCHRTWPYSATADIVSSRGTQEDNRKEKRMKRTSTTLVFLTLLFAVAISASAQMPMPKPAPELKNLDYFVGAWTLDGNEKPGPMGPGGKMTETETCKWMAGGFFLVCSVDFKSVSMGSGTGTSYLGYNTEDKVYTYDGFNSTGEAEHAKGTLEGNTWTWTSDEKMNGQTVKGRFTMKTLSPTSYTFQFEMSGDGTNWTTAMDGTAKKK
jgi:hypothetical protein